jgi:signal transduction histidine kinase
MNDQTTRHLPNYLKFEPHILSILRWTMSIICLLTLLGVPGAINSFDRVPNDYLTMLQWLFAFLLVVYLFIPVFRQQLKHRFIPLTIGALSVIPVINIYTANWLYLRQHTAVGIEFLDAGQLYIWIIIALVLVSTHYGVKVILMFIGGTSLLALSLAYWQQQAFGIDLAPTVEGVGGWLTVFLFAGYYVHQLTKSIRQQQVSLAEQNAKLADYANTVEQLAVTRERNRLARELHDTLAHSLSAVEMQLKALDVLIQRNPEAARQHLAETRSLTRDGLQEARRSLHDLRVQPVEEFGLLLALERLAQQTAHRTEITPSIVLPQKLSGVPPHVEQQLYRIAEEAINNVARHANAAQFWLELKELSPQIRLTIRDDGVGFDPNLLPEGRYGLSGIRERAALINASLTINSAPDQGSSIVVVWEQNND